MQQVVLPPWLRVPGIMWVVLLTGGGIWAYYNVADPVLFNLISGGIVVAMRLLVNNDKALEQAVTYGTTVLDYVFRQERRKLAPPTVAATGMRSAPTIEAIEPVPTGRMPEQPNKLLSTLFG